MSLAAWAYLRPDTAQIERRLEVSVGAGALAARYGLHSVFTLPAGDVTLERVGHPLDARPYLLTPEATTFRLDRWSTAVLATRPGLEPAPLRWRGPELSNEGGEVLTEVYVVGLGHQPQLGPGRSLVPRPTEDRTLPELYTTLVPALPAGSGLALSGRGVVIALPQDRVDAGARPALARGQP